MNIFNVSSCMMNVTYKVGKKDIIMICVILVASIESDLVKEIEGRRELSHLRGLPKALLPLAGKSILDLWWYVP
jgi:hypothetical protein